MSTGPLPADRERMTVHQAIDTIRQLTLPQRRAFERLEEALTMAYDLELNLASLSKSLDDVKARLDRATRDAHDVDSATAARKVDLDRELEVYNKRRDDAIAQAANAQHVADTELSKLREQMASARALLEQEFADRKAALQADVAVLEARLDELRRVRDEFQAKARTLVG